MQHKAIWKDTFRELKKSVMRFLAILIIIFLGVGFYVGISATSPNMLWTADEYFSNQNLMDFRVLSTYGLTDADVEDLKSLEGYKAEALVGNDFIVADYSETIRLFSYDLYEGQEFNEYYVIDGRLPETSGEIALDSNDGFLSGTQIGDTISLEIGKNTGAAKDNLHTQSFEVVGFVTNPMYIEKPSRGNTTMGSGTLNGFGVIPKEDYNMDLHTEAYLSVAGSEDYEAYSGEYEKFVEQESTGLEDLLEEMETRRADEIEDEFQTEIADGWAELEEGEQELADAEAELIEARQELDDGWQAYEDGLAEFQQETANAEQELNSNEADLQQTLRDLNAQEQELIAQRADLRAQLTELNTNADQLQSGREQLETGLSELEAGILEIENNLPTIETGLAELEAGLSQLEATLENPLLPPDDAAAIEAEIAGLETQRAELQDTLQTTRQTYDGLLAQRTELQNQLATLNAQEQELIAGQNAITDGINQINNGLTEISNGRTQINDGLRQIVEGRQTLLEETQKAQAELAEAEQELNNGEAEYQEGLETFESKRQTAEEEIKEARQELEEAEEDFKSMPAPEYMFFDRADSPGYLEYKDNADRLSIIAVAFPGFFFLIAIFISLTTMTRMVEEEREYIGLMKALGYPNHKILTKFITYAVLATAAGSVLGLLAGYTLIPKLIFFAYASMYNFPFTLIQGYPLYTTIALIAAFASTVGASLLAVRHSLQSNAATLLQPKAPKKGSRIWLERIPFIWKRLSFNYKITFRNVFRYKSRMLMTIFGIAGSTGLILTGFGISDSISAIPDIQYGELNQFQAYVALDPNIDDTDLEAHTETIQNNEQIDDALLVSQISTTAIREGINEQTVSLFVPNEPERMNDFIALPDYENGTPHSLVNTGAHVTQKLARLFDLDIGDELEVVSADDEEWMVEVAGIVENYIGHTLYITPAYFEEVTGEAVSNPNLDLVHYDLEEVDEAELGREIMQTDEVAGVNYVSDVSDAFSGTLDSLDLITQILVVAAAALAFIVLYNLTNINVSERKRELSTIKVLGSYNSEVTMYIYRENIILTIFGILVGLGFGTVLTNFIMDTMEVDMLVFGREIHLSSYIYSSVLTIIFTLIVMFVIHKQLKRVDMVEALKAND